MSAPTPVLSAELKALLRAVKLGRCTDTLPERLAWPRPATSPMPSFWSWCWPMR